MTKKLNITEQTIIDLKQEHEISQNAVEMLTLLLHHIDTQGINYVIPCFAKIEHCSVLKELIEEQFVSYPRPDTTITPLRELVSSIFKKHSASQKENASLLLKTQRETTTQGEVDEGEQSECLRLALQLFSPSEYAQGAQLFFVKSPTNRQANKIYRALNSLKPHTLVEAQDKLTDHFYLTNGQLYNLLEKTPNDYTQYRAIKSTIENITKSSPELATIYKKKNQKEYKRYNDLKDKEDGYAALYAFSQHVKNHAYFSSMLKMTPSGYNHKGELVYQTRVPSSFHIQSNQPLGEENAKLLNNLALITDYPDLNQHPYAFKTASSRPSSTSLKHQIKIDPLAIQALQSLKKKDKASLFEEKCLRHLDLKTKDDTSDTMQSCSDQYHDLLDMETEDIQNMFFDSFVCFINDTHNQKQSNEFSIYKINLQQECYKHLTIQYCYLKTLQELHPIQPQWKSGNDKSSYTNIAIWDSLGLYEYLICNETDRKENAISCLLNLLIDSYDKQNLEASIPHWIKSNILNPTAIDSSSIQSEIKNAGAYSKKSLCILRDYYYDLSLHDEDDTLLKHSMSDTELSEDNDETEYKKASPQSPLSTSPTLSNYGSSSDEEQLSALTTEALERLNFHHTAHNGTEEFIIPSDVQSICSSVLPTKHADERVKERAPVSAERQKEIVKKMLNRIKKHGAEGLPIIIERGKNGKYKIRQHALKKEASFTIITSHDPETTEVGKNPWITYWPSPTANPTAQPYGTSPAYARPRPFEEEFPSLNGTKSPDTKNTMSFWCNPALQRNSTTNQKRPKF